MATVLHRRSPLRLAAIAVGIVLVAVGLALMLLPYDKTIVLPMGSLVTDPIEARCEGPIIDAFRPEPKGWLNYSPDEDAFVEGRSTLTGTLCAPESTQRGAIGLLLVLFGGGVLLGQAAAAKRRKQPAEGAAADTAAATATATEPVDRAGSADVID